MTPTNYYRAKEFALKWYKQENPDIDNPDHEVSELIRKGVFKIGHPPVTKYADKSGRYFIVGANGL
jgi:hypothetical protein